MPLSRVAKREYMRLYMRRIRSNSAKLVRPGGEGESPYPLLKADVRYLNRYDRKNDPPDIRDVRPIMVRRWALSPITKRAFAYWDEPTPQIRVYPLSRRSFISYTAYLAASGLTLQAIDDATGEILDLGDSRGAVRFVPLLNGPLA